MHESCSPRGRGRPGARAFSRPHAEAAYAQSRQACIDRLVREHLQLPTVAFDATCDSAMRANCCVAPRPRTVAPCTHSHHRTSHRRTLRMSIEAGSEITLEIEKPAVGGRMLARHDGQVVLVWGAIPGERVRARVERSGKGVLFAESTEVIVRVCGSTRSRRRLALRGQRLRPHCLRTAAYASRPRSSATRWGGSGGCRCPRFPTCCPRPNAAIGCGRGYTRATGVWGSSGKARTSCATPVRQVSCCRRRWTGLTRLSADRRQRLSGLVGRRDRGEHSRRSASLPPGVAERGRHRAIGGARGRRPADRPVGLDEQTARESRRSPVRRR